MAQTLVIVTGGSSGIGRALLDRCPEPGSRKIDISRRGGADVDVHLAADLSRPESWSEVSELLERELAAFTGERVVLFHSAGTLEPIGFAGEVDPEAYARNVVLNSAAPQVVGAAFVRAAAGTSARCFLVNVGSGAAHSVYEGWSAYCGGKAAADHWVRTVGAEQHRRGDRIRVLSVAPGVVETAMQAQIRETDAHDFPDVARFVALHEGGDLRDTAAVAADFWGLLEKDLPNGSVLDLRDA
jgi:benzil reductase ((S)-benzoin forming)